MSKSYGNTIEIFEEPGKLKKKIMRIATDSRPMEEPKDPEGDHLFQLFSLFANHQQKSEVAKIYQAGGFGYGEIKKRLLEASTDYFSVFCFLRETLASDTHTVRQILADGAAKAREKAGEVLLRAQKACGVK